MTRYLILGNGAAGATAAEEVRRLDARGEITLVSPEKHLMYSRPGLAYVASGEIPARQVVARTHDWYAERHLRVVHGGAARLDSAARRVHLADGQALPYDRLLIATGARAVPLPYPGANLEGVVYLDTLDGTLDLLRRVKRARRGVVVGGGITALELAESFAHHKLETHYFARKDTLWSVALNADESRLLARHMESHGIRIHYHTELAEVLGDRHHRVSGVRTAGGETLACNLLGAGLGVRPQVEWLRGSEIRLDKAILVDERLQTNLPDVYAAGDCAQMWDGQAQAHLLDVLWPTAIAAGRTAGRNLAGQSEAYVKGPPFNACLLFGLHVTAIGKLGTARDEIEPEVFQHLSRGASETWGLRPRSYQSAWSHTGDNGLRLVLDDNRLAGALVIGRQTLADPLRGLIERGADVGPLGPHLAAGGEPLAAAVRDYWRWLSLESPASGK